MWNWLAFGTHSPREGEGKPWSFLCLPSRAEGCCCVSHTYLAGLSGDMGWRSLAPVTSRVRQDELKIPLASDICMQKASVPGEHSSACVINNTCISSAIPAPWTRGEDDSSCYTGDRFGERGFYFWSWRLPSSCRGRGMAVESLQPCPGSMHPPTLGGEVCSHRCPLDHTAYTGEFL